MTNGTGTRKEPGRGSWHAQEERGWITTLSDDTYRAADGSSQLGAGSRLGGGSVPAGQWPAEIAGENAASAVVARLRLVQVYLTPGMDEFLRQARSWRLRGASM